ncbi:unnamed protein product [Gulo gulo]|uniref:Uncharacterized protein n=1 Tax=Gulo gulo TaxID=48420 RepID=A0A9X9LEW7_GULGU|nr:unnamed protein product [Gulo gulo]
MQAGPPSMHLSSGPCPSGGREALRKPSPRSARPGPSFTRYLGARSTPRPPTS